MDAPRKLVAYRLASYRHRPRLAFARRHRLVPALKDVPTIIETGYPTLASEDWTDKVRDALAKVGTDPGGGTPEAFGKLVNDESETAPASYHS
jgi:hypothetical protein